MDVNNSDNRSFYNDFITEDWAKKKWVSNLIHFGSAFVAYKIEFGCLGLKDKITKISQFFFKSPIHMATKKIAQYLWVPIVICGIIKLASLIVTANRCFHSANREPPRQENQPLDDLARDQQIAAPSPSCDDVALEISANRELSRQENQLLNSIRQDFVDKSPFYVALEIFSYLNLHTLGVCCRASKKWSQLASDLILRKKAIYREIAFSSKNWAQCDKDTVKDEDYINEFSSLPDNIVEEFRHSYKAFPGRKLIETHMLVRIHKGFTIRKLGEIAKKYFPSNVNGFRIIGESIIDDLSDQPIDQSYWVLMTKDLLPGSREKNYADQHEMITSFAEKTLVPYVAPTTIEAVACILAQYFSSETRLFSDSPWTYTRVHGCQVIVGGFSSSGLYVDYHRVFVDGSVGVAALKRL